MIALVEVLFDALSKTILDDLDKPMGYGLPLITEAKGPVQLPVKNIILNEFSDGYYEFRSE